MRLIDADELLKFFTVDTANQTYRFGTVKKQIENAPTVPAVPLERIKQLREEIVSFRQHMDKFMLTSQKNRFDSIIADLDNMIKEYSNYKGKEVVSWQDELHSKISGAIKEYSE